MTAIHEASERILATEGPDALNTNRIAEVAGVNIASVYRYFPNKEAIVAEVYERRLSAHAAMLDSLYARADEIDAFDLEATIRFVVDTLVDLHVGMLALDAEFYRRHQTRFDLASRRNERHERSWVEQMQAWLTDVLTRHATRLRTRDPARAAFIVAHSLGGVFRAAVRDAPDHLRAASFREDVVALELGLLIGRAPERTQVEADGLAPPDANRP